MVSRLSEPLARVACLSSVVLEVLFSELRDGGMVRVIHQQSKRTVKYTVQRALAEPLTLPYDLVKGPRSPKIPTGNSASTPKVCMNTSQRLTHAWDEADGEDAVDRVASTVSDVVLLKMK